MVVLGNRAEHAGRLLAVAGGHPADGATPLRIVHIGAVPVEDGRTQVQNSVPLSRQGRIPPDEVPVNPLVALTRLGDVVLQPLITVFTHAVTPQRRHR